MVLEEIDTYIEDDWDDNALTNRTNSREGYFLHPSDDLLSGDFEAGDALKGVYRPDWRQVEGSATVSGGLLRVPADTTAIISSPSEFNTGTFETTFSLGSAGSAGTLGLRFVATNNNNTLEVAINYAGPNYTLRKQDGGTFTELTSSAKAPDSGTAKVTRDSYGNFELFLDGVSEGVATDTFVPEEVRTTIRPFNVNAEVQIDTWVLK